MPIQNGQFVPPIFAKQAEILNDTHRYLLVSGPRFCGKTLGCLHALVWNLWRTKDAHWAIVGRTNTDNFDGGAWTDLVDTVLPAWLEAGFMHYVTEPRMTHLTHKFYLEVNNAHGGVSKVQLDSLAVESEAERKFKGKRYSGIYMTEGSNFKERTTFSVLQECLRKTHLRPEQHRFIIDTNPADEGTDHWIYKLFWNDRLHNDWEGKTPEYIATKKAHQAMFGVIEFTVDDNEFISQEQKNEQRIKYDYDPELFARYYMGQWVKANSRSVFRDVFSPARHVWGETPENPNDEPNILLPEENCSELFLSFDLGNANSAIVFAEKITLPRKDKPGQTWSAFKFLDEVVVLGEATVLEDIVLRVMEKMDFWESVIGHPVIWKCWSDSSSIDYKQSIADRSEQVEVFNVSKGRIILQAATKGRESVEAGKKLMRKLFFQDRIFLSQHKTPQLIDAIRGLPNTKEGRVDKRSHFKHAFDAARYLLSMECWAEMEEESIIHMGKPTAPVVFSLPS